MNNTYNATASIDINAAATDVWQAFVNPDIFQQWMFGTVVTSDWKKGGSIIYKGEWDGKAFEDKGTILEIIPNHLLKATYFSPQSGKKDLPENYQIVTYTITEIKDGCNITIVQENNASQEASDKASDDWNYLLASVKKLVEKH